MVSIAPPRTASYWLTEGRRFLPIFTVLFSPAAPPPPFPALSSVSALTSDPGSLSLNSDSSFISTVSHFMVEFYTTHTSQWVSGGASRSALSEAAVSHRNFRHSTSLQTTAQFPEVSDS